MPIPNPSQTPRASAPEHVPTAQSTYGPRVRFDSLGVLPPTAVYVGPDDTIQIWARNPSIAVTINIHYRLLLPSGEIKACAETFTSSAAALTPNKRTIPATEGFLLSMTLYAPAISRGQCFVRVFLAAGDVSVNTPLDHLLIQGYVSEDDRLGFPQSPTESSLSGRGWLRDIQQGAPAAGLTVTIPVTSGVHWMIRALRTSFVASAAIANRLIVAAAVDPGGNISAIQQLSTAITAGQTWNIGWAPGLTFGAMLPWASAGFPADLILPGGWQISIGCTGIDAADAFGLSVLTVEEWIGQ
jgi:hypothetical protein